MGRPNRQQQVSRRQPKVEFIKHSKFLNRCMDSGVLMIVSSVVANLVKGPPISNSDNIALQKFADRATRPFATLASMNCLSQINQGIIVSMAEQLPKWLQNKFAQHFPTLTNCVDFVNKQAISFVSSKNLCPNGLKNTEHTAVACPSSFRCRVEGCGAFHHSLLHQPQPRHRPENPTPECQVAAVDTITSNSLCAATRTADSGILLQVLLLRVVSSNGLAVTTYAMLDSGSDVILVDPSLVSGLGLCG